MVYKSINYVLCAMGLATIVFGGLLLVGYFSVEDYVGGLIGIFFGCLIPSVMFIIESRKRNGR